LAWKYAHELVTQYSDFAPIEQAQSFVEITESFLLSEAEKMVGVTVLTTSEKLNLMVQHDQVRFYTESGYPEAAISAAEAFLEQFPDGIPVLNNLSLSQFIAGNAEQAIATAQKVLELEPDNVHALGNLTRFTFLTGLSEQAKQYASRLQQITGDDPDVATKKVEALAFLGDDQGIRAVYKQAKAQHDELNPLLLHLAAVAHYRLGKEKTAWRLWQKAVELAPSLQMAQESLAERHLPVGDRDIPWYWPLSYWFSDDFHRALKKSVGKNLRRKSNKSVERLMRSLLAERPYLLQLFPDMLERGDRATREFVLNIIRIADTPELRQTLYDFALSQYGADDLRLEAIHFIRQDHPELLPENEQVPMWLKGRQTEMFLMDFEVTDEPELMEGVSEEILEKYEAAYDLLMNDKPEGAEPLLQEIIAAAPEFYTAYNQLAVAYEQQGRPEEAWALIEETHARFPDYLFARVALARILIQEKRIEEASDLLTPLLRRRKLHISEFRSLARAQMDLALVDGHPEAARSWWEMWQQMEEDNPELDEWQMRIDGPGKLRGTFTRLLRRQSKNRR
jgi:tetratricopeptide (TPR) repeat protein